MVNQGIRKYKYRETKKRMKYPCRHVGIGHVVAALLGFSSMKVCNPDRIAASLYTRELRVRFDPILRQ
jgi:hypothetical protein